jgi:succinate dehydrogenase/fumarate reductase-like Fe-S protein
MQLRAEFVRVCPKNIPLTTSISIIYGQAMKQALTNLFRK